MNQLVDTSYTRLGAGVRVGGHGVGDGGAGGIGGSGGGGGEGGAGELPAPHDCRAREGQPNFLFRLKERACLLQQQPTGIK